MITISKPLGITQATTYYRTELQPGADISHAPSLSAVSTVEEQSHNRYHGEWYGKLAERMDLRGAVGTEQFERLCRGVHPHTEEALIRHSPVKNYTGKFGKEITTMGHRAGWDITVSPPKSVSLAAIVGGDDRVREAHGQSVAVALGELEKYTYARIGGNKPSERTGQMISAMFEHDTARPDRTFKYAAPQLHTHVLTFNMTETAGGTVRPLQPLEIYKSQKYATAVYRAELADRLQKIGYDIEIDRRTGAPEISGFSSEYLKMNSPRSAEIQTEAAAVRNRFEMDGGSISGGDAGIRQVAAWQGRETKGFDPEEMKMRALEIDVRYDFQAQRIVDRAMEQNGFKYDAATTRHNAREAVDLAKAGFLTKKAFENDVPRIDHSVPMPESLKKIDERRFLTAALEKGVGSTTFVAIQEEYSVRSSAGEFSHFIKDENEKALSNGINQGVAIQAVTEKIRGTGKEVDRHEHIDHYHNELKYADRMIDFSVNELENSGKENTANEKENAQSIGMGIDI